MKKYFLISIIAVAVPLTAFASWWNPSTWFQASSVENVQPFQQMTQQFSTSTEATSTTSNFVNATSTSLIQVVNQSATTTDQTTLQSKINVLIAQNNSLQSKLNTIESQLVAVQKNYSMCQVSLTAAQNTNTTSQIQQPTVTTAIPVIVPSTASISRDNNNPVAHTVSSVSGQYPDLPILTFDIVPSNNNQTLDSLTVNINDSGQGSVNTANLYVSGFSTPVATAVVSSGSVTFSDIQNIPSLSTSLSPYDIFIIKVDVSGLTDVGSSESVSASVSNAIITDSAGHSVSTIGTAQGKVVTVTSSTTTTSSLNSTTPQKDCTIAYYSSTGQPVYYVALPHNCSGGG